MLLIIPAVLTMAGIGLLIKKNGWHFWREKTLKEIWLEKKAAGEEDADEENPQKRAAMQIARWQYEYDILKDPTTGKIPRNAFSEEMKQALRSHRATTHETQFEVFEFRITR